MPALLIALAVVAGIQPGLALAQDDGRVAPLDRFKLYNACRPIVLVVEDVSYDAFAIGLTKDRVKLATESRLRAARLYTEDSAKATYAWLYVTANVYRAAFSLTVEYRKRLFDPVSGETWFATTWNKSITGSHGDNPGFIVQDLSEKVDKFLVEYLRVNEKDCPR